MQTVDQLAAKEYGHGVASVSATQFLWDSLPTMDIDRVERIVRTAMQGEQYKLIIAALRNATPERGAALKARFTTDEIQAMVRQ